MQSIQNLFLELIHIVIGLRTELSEKPKDGIWAELHTIAEQQTMLGICFAGIEKLPKQQLPDKDLLMKWFVQAEYIKSTNSKVYNQCLFIQKRLCEAGFDNCLLKGQGVACYYPKELRNLRQSGDIDLWVDAPIDSLLTWIKKIHPLHHCDYMHTHIDVFNDTQVEIHYRPWISRNLIRNRKLQTIARNCSKQFLYIDGELCVPNQKFNVLHVLYHLYWHFLVEGIGLRQFLDLYFVLKNSSEKPTLEELKNLDMVKFTSAVMWVLEYTFGLDRKHMLCMPDSVEGRFLLSELLLAGNFGHYDRRIKHSVNESIIVTILKWLKHSLRLFKHYPKEVMWNPIGIAYLSIRAKFIRFC